MTNTLRSILLGLVGLLLLIGCGGGGGETPQSSDLVYKTFWTSRADPASGTGQSQVVILRNSTGTILRNLVLNRSNSSQLDIADIPSGAITMEAFLYSQADANGQFLGSVKTVLTISAQVPAAVETEVGGTVADVLVTPGTATWEQDESRTFTAAARTNGGAFVFTDPNSFTWTGLGGVVSVNSSGIALGTAGGSGSVRVTHTPSGSIGTAPVTITPFVATRSKWTVLVYLNAANDLFSYSDLNVNQMEAITTNDVRFAVQWKQSQSVFPSSSFNGTRRYLATPGTDMTKIGSQLVQDMGASVDMGSAQTLKEFIEWGKRRYPADRYALVVWNHGSGWNRGNNYATRAVSYDDEMQTVIQTWELPTALQGQKFDIIAWDASLMQMAEVAYEVKDFADYVVGSQESPPGEGYPYNEVFKPFVQNPDAATKVLSKGFVDGMNNYPPYASRKITQSVIETSKLAAVATATQGLKLALLSEQTALNRAAFSYDLNFGNVTGGSYRVRYRGEISQPAFFNSDMNTNASALQARLELMPSIGAGNVLVTVVGAKLRIKFPNRVSDTQVDNVSLDAANLTSTVGTVSASLTPYLEIQEIRDTVQSYSPSVARFYRDFIGVCTELKNRPAIPVAVQNAANTTLTALQDAVVWEGHNANSIGSRGLAIDFTASSRFSSYASDYARLKWNQDSGWGSWLLVAP